MVPTADDAGPGHIPDNLALVDDIFLIPEIDGRIHVPAHVDIGLAQNGLLGLEAVILEEVHIRPLKAQVPVLPENLLIREVDVGPPHVRVPEPVQIGICLAFLLLHAQKPLLRHIAVRRPVDNHEAAVRNAENNIILPLILPVRGFQANEGSIGAVAL